MSAYTSQTMLTSRFFNRDAKKVAQDLLGKVIRARHENIWLSAMIIETEAYYLWDKASHASLGYTEKRKALFMPAGTIYMYYSRGGDSLNISCRGKGNAVLIKSAIPYLDDTKNADACIQLMQKLNPCKNGRCRIPNKLCGGQTLLCQSLGLKVKEWDQKQFDPEKFYFEDVGYRPKEIIQTKRLGIREGRDEHLLHRFIDKAYAMYCTKNPLIRDRGTAYRAQSLSKIRNKSQSAP